MAQFDTPYTSAPEELPVRPRKWPLVAVMLIDLVIILVLVLVLITIVSAVIIGVRMAQSGSGRNGISQEEALNLLGPNGVFLTLLIQNGIFVLVPLLRVGLIRREPLAEIGFQAPRPLRLVALGLGMAVVMYIGSIAISLAFASLGIQQDQAEQLTKQFSLSPTNTLGQALFLIGGGLLAPIGEETVFRGYVFNAIRLTFRERAWGIPLAYLGSALLFAVIHVGGVSQGAAALIVPIFFIALVMAWGMHRTGSLLPSIVAHAVFNSVQLVALLACLNNPGISGCPKL